MSMKRIPRYIILYIGVICHAVYGREGLLLFFLLLHRDPCKEALISTDKKNFEPIP
jgi:hypothetical protein